MQSDKRIQKMPTECTVWLLSHDVWFPTRKSDDSRDAWMYWSPSESVKAFYVFICIILYYIMCIKSEQFIVYTLIVGRFHDQASPKYRLNQLPNDAGSCYDASASLNSNNSNSLQLWTLDTEARNSQEDLAERSNIGSEFFIAGNQHPCRCRVVRKPLRLPVQLKP